ncbi:MAG TPA: hypothetical protein VHX37_05050 [Acidobacteriaceae bacterium]|jgi:hypothetical protein|nr:hypothetical protein [Acidobacteriaceae bacterium]
MTDPRSLAQQSFASLDAMMQAYAGEAARIAEVDHGMALDYSPESIARLETVLAARGPAAESEQDEATRLWGAYYGEIFRHRWPACQWVMAVYPGQYKAGQLNSGRADAGTDLAMPALDHNGSHVYPLLKVFRRLTMGPSEDLAAFYAKVSAALDAQARKDP